MWGRPHWVAAHGRRSGGNLLRACESREQGRDGRDTPRGRRLGDDGVPRCPCAAPMLPMPMSMRCTSGHGAMSRLPRPPRRPRPNPVPMRTCCDMESCAHGTHCRTGSTCAVRSLLQLAGQSHAAQEKCHVGMAAAEKRARLKSAFMAASTESFSPLRPACRAPVGRSAPASLSVHLTHATRPMAADVGSCPPGTKSCPNETRVTTGGSILFVRVLI